MTKECDNRSVGVVLINSGGEYGLLERRKFPVGIAPVAGHIDDHGSPEQAAIEEASEEVGVKLAISGLSKTAITARRVENVCRRPGGDHHIWTVYVARVASGGLQPDPDETQGARWYPQNEVQALADRTREYQAGNIPEDEWTEKPGLEPVWVPFLTELGHIR